MLRLRRVESKARGGKLKKRGAVILGGALVCVSAALAFIWFAPLPKELQRLTPLTGVYLDSKGRIIAELAGPEARSHRPISLAQMGPWIPSITVALEDRRFYSHPGIDFIGTARALLTGHGGGSTITQQLVKIATARKGRSIVAKVNEMIVALQLERHWTKQQILEAYLNRIPYGNRLLGIEAAAQGYFNKPASQLSKPESIYLAGLPRQPSRLNPWRHSLNAARQFEQTRKRLVRGGGLSPRENAEMGVPEIGRFLPKNTAPHFIQVVAKAGERGLISCTIDPQLQQRAQELVREQLDFFHRQDISQAAMVVIENETGAVRALVGSRDFSADQINGALSFRNCGSTLKPFLYLTGIDRRVFTAATLLPDTPDAARDAYGDYDPHNFVLSHLGPVRVREALGNSLNVPAVVAVNRVGARKAYDAIASWGIRFDRPLEKAGAGFILGNVGVRLIDLTGAFASLARGGVACPPRFLSDAPLILSRVSSPEAAQIVTDILCDNSARLQSFGPHSALAFPVRVAGKTGTSAGFRDAWAVGFTREHTVGVWVGNFDGRPMDHAASIASAAPLWRRMMDDLIQLDHPVAAATLPRVPICALSGLRPCPKSPAVVKELFLPGTEPQGRSDSWFRADGRPVLPQEYASWCASADNFLRASVATTADNLAIIAPRDQSVFVLDSSLAPAQQQLELEANLQDGIAWRINGVEVPRDPEGRVFWQLKEGEWTVEASSACVTQTRHFSVRKQ